jgi:hypothetical protein
VPLYSLCTHIFTYIPKTWLYGAFHLQCKVYIDA